MSKVRLIDAKRLVADKAYDTDAGGYVVNVDDIHAAPTIDPVKRARWEMNPKKPYREYKCSDCGSQRGDWKQVYGFSVVSVDGYCDEGERRMDAVALSETETTTEEEKDE